MIENTKITQKSLEVFGKYFFEFFLCFFVALKGNFGLEVQVHEVKEEVAKFLGDFKYKQLLVQKTRNYLQIYGNISFSPF